MTSLELVMKRIRPLLKEYLSSHPETASRKKTIPLNIPTFGSEEIANAIEVMLSTNVTMGERVREFEEAFSKYIGVRNGIMVNSGSSANLIALSVISNPALSNHIPKNAEIIAPAVTWSTSVFPIMNLSRVPVFVDVEAETYNVDVEAVEKAITSKTKAIMAVNLLGNPCDMKRIMEIASKHDLFVVEDTCESHGAMVGHKKAGSFGHLSSFSFFFSHHISTVEGGMVMTDDDEYADLSRALRAHGWTRELTSRQDTNKKYPLIDRRFLFVNAGYNLRPSEIHAAFGIPQLNKLEGFIRIRRQNAAFWSDNLKKYGEYFLLPQERKGTRHVYFGYPITVKQSAPFTMGELVAHLETNGIETRPIMGGNLVEQPGIRLFKHRVSGDLKVSRDIMRSSFFFGNHHGVGEEERQYVVDCIDQFMMTKIR